MIKVINGDCLEELPKIESQSIDAVITDGPYAEIDREYGRWTEEDWHALMNKVVAECKRVLKPSGSAMFIVQPNSEHVGQMRLWVWEFLVRTAKDWNLIQDVYWWNHTTPPTVHCHRDKGLMRPSVKYCLWFGSPSCYRNQDEILWTISDDMKATRLEDRALRYQPSGLSTRHGRMFQTCTERGGSTPFNLIPLSPSNSVDSSGALGHGAGTPYKLCEWWVKYICPPGGTILDMFAGLATVGLAADRNGRNYIGIEKDEAYCATARKRLGIDGENQPVASN